MSQLCKFIQCADWSKKLLPKHAPTAFDYKRRYEKLAIAVSVLQNNER